jgi:hypothetical protein
MRFMVEISGRNVLLTYEQLEKFSTLLCDAEDMHDAWVGKAHSSNGYIKNIKPFSPLEHLRLHPVSDEKVEAIKFVQKQQEKSE